jgi:hypothetical protein
MTVHFQLCRFKSVRIYTLNINNVELRVSQFQSLKNQVRPMRARVKYSPNKPPLYIVTPATDSGTPRACVTMETGLSLLSNT